MTCSIKFLVNLIRTLRVMIIAMSFFSIILCYYFGSNLSKTII